jgi:dienelactone hydrolase|tara:strand:- start:2415 stop:3359 length:945 start_codon:yes stop_codon:yes gene_type:complete
MKIQHKSLSLLSLLAASALMFSASTFAYNPAPPPPSPTPTPTPGPLPGQPNDGFQRGPNPSVSLLEAERGPFSVRNARVSSSVRGFGGGTIYYPTGTTGTMGAIVVIPGYVSPESSIAWWGPKMASHGFVVMTIATNRTTDQPSSRATQINAALDYLISQNSTSGSPVRNMIDTDRLGVMGWSMGGGGTLRVASQNRLKAAIPLAPYDTISFRNVDAPTLIFGCESDTVAPVRNHASPFYNQIPAGTDKAFVELNGGSHTCANGGNQYNDVLSRLGVSWMKRHLDNDTRYSQFLCGPNHTSDRDISEYRGNCPY